MILNERFDLFSLLVEEIDVGEAKARQVVSGLAKYCSPDSLVVCSSFGHPPPSCYLIIG